jgi:hypothetical protein
MASTIKVDNIQDSSGNNIINESGDTITIGASGDTTNIVGTLQNNGSSVGESNTPAFSAYRGSSQSISNESYTRVSFNYEFYDTDNAFDPNTTQRFTVPSGKAGKYHFDAMVRFSAFTGEVRLVPYKNGGDYGFQSTYIGNKTTTVTSSFDLDLSVGDYIEIYCWQNSGGSLNLSADTTDPILTTFSGFRITS